MNRSGLWPGVLIGIAVSGAAAGGYWLVMAKPAAVAKHDPLPGPANVSQILKEDQITTIKLRPEALERLGLKTAVVERKPMRRVRVYGGEVLVPPGRTILVAAPLSGSLRAPSRGVPQPGQLVKKGQVIVDLLPLLTPEGRANLASAKIDAEGQVRSAQTQVDAARVAFERAERVFKSDAGSRKGVDESQAQYDLAQKTLEAATARSSLLEKVVGEVSQGTAGPLPIESPDSGMLRNLSALPGQNVPAGAALFEVVDLTRLWVRVPVFVGDMPEIDSAMDAQIGPLTLRTGDATRPAKRAASPPSANATTGTIDQFFELQDEGGKFAPGQRVGVSLALKDPAESLSLPWSAVVHDLHGGTWVYEQTGDKTYVRRRVAVRNVAGDFAVLDAGPAAGAVIVATGAAELFGAETGFTK